MTPREAIGSKASWSGRGLSGAGRVTSWRGQPPRSVQYRLGQVPARSRPGSRAPETLEGLASRSDRTGRCHLPGALTNHHCGIQLVHVAWDRGRIQGDGLVEGTGGRFARLSQEQTRTELRVSQILSSVCVFRVLKDLPARSVRSSQISCLGQLLANHHHPRPQPPPTRTFRWLTDQSTVFAPTTLKSFDRSSPVLPMVPATGPSGSAVR